MKNMVKVLAGVLIMGTVGSCKPASSTRLQESVDTDGSSQDTAAVKEASAKVLQAIFSSPVFFGSDALRP